MGGYYNRERRDTRACGALASCSVPDEFNLAPSRTHVNVVISHGCRQLHAVNVLYTSPMIVCSLEIVDRIVEQSCECSDFTQVRQH